MGSGAGIGQKPDDWRTVSLCRSCHALQHEMGEPSFWTGNDVEKLIREFCNASPKSAEIRAIQRERGL